MIRTFQLVLLLVLVLGTALARGASNLLENGGFETAPASPGAAAQELPSGWEPLIISGPSKIVVDGNEKHGGASSVRVDAPENTRSYVRSATPIEIAPGETIEASAWVKVKNVPPEKGAVILIAEFADSNGDFLDVAKFDTAQIKEPPEGWQHVSGTVKAPARAAQLHLRMGFSYSQGTCWWDDVTVMAKQPLVCRVDLPNGRLSPAMRQLPVTVINRTNRKGGVPLKVTLNKESFTSAATLTGQAVDRAPVAIAAPKPGKVAIVARLEEKNGKSIFTAETNAVVPPPLVLGVPLPTHGCVEDGPPLIEGLVYLAVSDEARQGATLKIQLLDSAGKFCGEWRPGGGELRDGADDFRLRVSNATEGDYKLVATFAPKQGKPITDEQPWHIIPRRLAQVTLNTRGYPEYDGKAIFPLGIFNGGKFKEQADSGFTVTHAYNAVRLEEDSPNADANARRWIDATHANGMKMLFMIPMKAAIAGDWGAVRRRVRMFRNHPALLAWDEEEGFARGDFRGDTLKTIRQIIAEEDPNHPFMVGDSRDVITRMPSDRSNFFPVDQMDLGMWWWYPFPLKPREGDALLGEDAGPPSADLLPPSFLVNARVKKPLWVGVQSYKKPGKDDRYPTPEEYRAQAYLALVRGAKGLMWYGGSVTGGLFLAPEEGHWPELKKLVRELRDRSELFMSPNDKMPTTEPANAPVDLVVKRTPKGKVTIAVNRSQKPIEITIGGKIIPLAPFGVYVGP
jgi:hypothetical protein